MAKKTDSSGTLAPLVSTEHASRKVLVRTLIRGALVVLTLLAARSASASVIISASDVHTAKGESGRFGIIDFVLKARVTPDQVTPPDNQEVSVLINGKALEPSHPLTWVEVSSGLLINTDLAVANGPPLSPPSTVRLTLAPPDGRVSKNILRTVSGEGGHISLDPSGRPLPGGTQTFDVVSGSDFTPLPPDVFGIDSFTAAFIPGMGNLSVRYASTSQTGVLAMFLDTGTLFLTDSLFGTSTVTFDTNVPIGFLTYIGSNGGVLSGDLSGRVTNSVLRDDLLNGIGPEFFSVDFSGTFTVMPGATGETTVAELSYGDALGSMSLFSLVVPEPSTLFLIAVGLTVVMIIPVLRLNGRG